MNTDKLKYFSFPRAAWECSHVGRNKPVRAIARTGVSGKHHPNSPETPPRATRLDGLIPAYTCVDLSLNSFSFPRATWECSIGALRRESRPTAKVLRIRDAARPAPHSHAARGNEVTPPRATRPSALLRSVLDGLILWLNSYKLWIGSES
ncbi:MULTISPECIES: hypothetical protein [Methylobacter]